MLNLQSLLALHRPDAVLAWRKGQGVSTRAVLQAAQALAQKVKAQGGGSQAAACINLCQDRLHFSIALLAAWMHGLSVKLPPNALLSTLQQVQTLDTAGRPVPVLAFVDAADEADLTPSLRASELPHLVVDVDALLTVPSSTPASTFEPALIRAATSQHDFEAVCLLTSGSTGVPQPHAKTLQTLQANIAAEAQALQARLQTSSLQGLTLVATVPPQHSYGLESSVLLALLGGASLHAGRPFYPADVAAALAEVPAPRALVTTPFHLKALLGAGVALPPTELVLSATAPLSPQLAAQAESAMGARLVEIYGCTEAGQVATRRTTQGDVWQTMGPLQIHREGAAEPRFMVQGGHVAEPTELADVLELLSPNQFKLLGRANDPIHVAGKRSSLAHLNFQLNRIAGVEDGAFWLPQAGADQAVEDVQRPVAFVVAPGLSSTHIVAALRKEIDAAFVPRRVVHVKALPREGTGKLTAGALQAFALATLSHPLLDAQAQAAAAAKPTEPASTASHGSPALAWTASADHPAFAGHFPGHPILPGVSLLALAMRALVQAQARGEAWAVALGQAPQIEAVKFLAPVRPGDEVSLLWLHKPGEAANQAGPNRQDFELRVGDQLVARGQLRAAP